jgi:hypothetical protein
VALQSVDNPTPTPTLAVVVVPILMVLRARVQIKIRQVRTFAGAAAAFFSVVAHKILAR